MTSLPRLLAAAAIATSLGVSAQSSKPMPAAMAASKVVVTATVVAIDLPNRIVSLKGENGDVSVLKVGPEVKNLAQVKVGDIVTSEYVRAVAIELKKGGDGIRSSTQEQAKVAAKPGDKPAGAVANQTVIMANVISVDTKASVVAVRGPQGNVVDIHVQDPAVLAQVKVGDQVEAVITEAVLVAVTAPKKK